MMNQRLGFHRSATIAQHAYQKKTRKMGGNVGHLTSEVIETMTTRTN